MDITTEDVLKNRYLQNRKGRMLFNDLTLEKYMFTIR
jgi:hypothetical protein